MDHLRGRLGRPGHAPHGARVGLEDDVDLGRAHGLAGVVGIIAGHRLQEDALGQAHALVLGELLPRASPCRARSPAMSGMMASTSWMPWSRKNCGCRSAWKLTCCGRGAMPRRRSARRPRRAPARRLAEGGEQGARKIVAHHLPLGMPLHREREGGARRRPGTPPPGRPAHAPRPPGRAPRSRTPWECSEFTRSCDAPPAHARSALPGSSSSSWAGAYCTASGCALVLGVHRVAVVRASGTSARAYRRTRRSSPASRGTGPAPARPPAIAARISGSVVASRSGSCSVPGATRLAAIVPRFDVRRTAGEQHAVELPRISSRSSGSGSTGISSGSACEACAIA